MIDYPDQLVLLSSFCSSHSLCRSLDLDELVQDSNLRLVQSSLAALVNRVFALLVQFELSIVPFVRLVAARVDRAARIDRAVIMKSVASVQGVALKPC